MKRILLSLVVGLMAFGPTNVDKVRRLDSDMGQCSAVLFGPKHIYITASHCVPEEGDMYVGALKAKLIERLAEDDLAVIQAEMTRFAPKPIKLGKRPQIGDDLYMVGFGMGAPKSLVFRTNLAAVLVPPGEEQEVSLLAEAALGGMSGGAVLNKDSKLVGVMQGGYTFAQHPVAYMSAYDVLKRLYEKFN